MSEGSLCAECGKHFANSYLFKRHIADTHETVNYICEDCGKTFSRPYNFQRHRTIHSGEPSSFLCEKCGKTFHRKDHYEYHLKTCESRQNFQCPLCNLKTSKEALLKHFSGLHGIEIKTETKIFQLFEDFESWKNQYEKENILFYRKGTKYSRDDGSKFYQYYCHRGGHFQPKDTYMRNIKITGSNKISGWCPSVIKVNVNKKGEVSMSFITTHVGHGVDLRRIQLPINEKDDAAMKSSAGVPNKTFLTEIKDSVPNSDLNRIHLLTRMDIENIKKEYNLKNGVPLKPMIHVAIEDLKVNTIRAKDKEINKVNMNLQSWVEEKTNKASVKYFKSQYSISDKYPQLEFDSYFLLIMTKPQTELLKKFGERFVCIDRQNGESFELVTVLILDDMDHSFPCAFLFTNKTDTNVMEVFFIEIKNVIGAVHTKLFMSGKAKFICDAWDSVMGPAEKNLFCSWDVLKDWKLNMCMMTNKEKQEDTYKALQTLLEETDIDTFSISFDSLLSNLCSDLETNDFASYIVDNYYDSQSSWGCCYRSKEGIPVNFQLERMHATFKHILQASCTKKINKALNAILSFLRSKIYDRLMLLSDGKVSSKLSDIRHRHKVAETLQYHVTNHGSYWGVVSGKKERNKVSVADKDCQCHLKCNVCQVCAHYYTCTCYDSTVNLNMCRHIHSVCINKTASNIIALEKCLVLGSEQADFTNGVINIKEESVVANQTVSAEDFRIGVLDNKQEYGVSNQAVASRNFSSGVMDAEQEYLVENQTLHTEYMEYSFEVMYEDNAEFTILEFDRDEEMELVFNGEACQEEEVVTFEEILPSATKTIESRKTGVEHVFKTVLNDINSEEQLNEIEVAVTSLKTKVNGLNSSGDNSCKKRTSYEKETQSIELQNGPSSSKKLKDK